MSAHRKWLIILVLFGTSSCAGTHKPNTLDTIPHINEANLAKWQRVSYVLPRDSKTLQLRDRLVAFQARKAAAHMNQQEAGIVLDAVRDIGRLYRPEELGHVEVSAEVLPLVRFLLAQGQPLGLEAQVLAAHRWIAWIRPEDKAERQRLYAEVLSWALQARSTLSVVSRHNEIVSLWEELAELFPSEDILQRLVEAYKQRQLAFRDFLGKDANNAHALASNLVDYNAAAIAIRRAPIDVAAVYLRHGDLRQAHQRILELGRGELEIKFAELIEDGIAGGASGRDALLAVARLYSAELEEFDVAAGVCRVGRARFKQDAHFSLCLARIAAADDRFDDATAHYADAVRLQPDERGIYDEALRVLQQMIEKRLFEVEPGPIRALAREAESILRERRKRWPQVPIPVSMAEFHFAIGTAEMNSGNPEQAKKRFERSVAAQRNAPALMRLGTLEERLNRPEQAVHYYERALSTRDATGESSALRAELLERLGDSQRALHHSDKAKQSYRRALAVWDTLEKGSNDQQRAFILSRQGVLLDRLGNFDKAKFAFAEAAELGSSDRSVYETVLSHLVTANADLQLATDVFHKARVQLSLKPEWNVYFSLWIKTIAARKGQTVDGEVDEVLRRYAPERAWWGWLAKYGVGDIKYEQLLDAAGGRGEKAEAHFYHAVRLWAQGKEGQAKAAFRKVLQMNMVSFYEHVMAQEFLLGRSVQQVH